MAKRFLGIRADWKALFFCVLAACTFWFFKAMNRDYSDVIAYPVRIEYDKQKFIPLAPLPDKVQISVKGYGWNLLRKSMGIGASPILYYPANLPQRKFIIASELRPYILNQLGDISLNYILEDTLFLRFDNLGLKKVKVLVDTASISLVPSYHITSPVMVSPDTVVFKGPSTLLEMVPDSIYIKIPKVDIKEDYEGKIKIPDQGYDPRINLVNKEVKVRFSVQEFEKESRTLYAQPVNFPADSSLIMFDPKVIITYYVSQEDRSKIQDQDFKVVLDLTKLDLKDSTIVPGLVKVPPFIRDYYLTPYAVKVRSSK